VKYKRKHVQDLLHTELRRRSVLPSELEDELANYCAVIEATYISAIYENKFQHPFILEDGRAGKKYLKGFLNRHPNLSMPKPKAV
jgi:hypothetical protein